MVGRIESPVEPFELLSRYYDSSEEAYSILVTHSVLVTRKALEIAAAFRRRHPEISVDETFLVESALLHDIGIGECAAPEIGCHGDQPYIRHGVLGREILESEGLPRHALVCERHTGAGLTREDVKRQGLQLPERHYLPESIEEKIICVADKCYSKTPAKLWREKSWTKVRKTLSKFGDDVLERWDQLAREVLGELAGS